MHGTYLVGSIYRYYYLYTIIHYAVKYGDPMSPVEVCR